jgi:hypothetical protein
MTGAVVHQRCWNHADREAACRCPACGRGFCRECVTEHAGRLLCASCLSRITLGSRASAGASRFLRPAVLACAGLALGWVLFFTAGEALIALGERAGAPQGAAHAGPKVPRNHP